MTENELLAILAVGEDIGIPRALHA